jgi:hypothetical protein
MNYRVFLDEVAAMNAARRAESLNEDLGLEGLSEEKLKRKLYAARLQQHSLREGTLERTKNDAIIEQITIRLEEGGPHTFVNVATSNKAIKGAEAALAAHPDMLPGPKSGYKTLITVHKKHLAKNTTPVAESEDLDEAANHTIEAQGIRGMEATPWRKTFKDADHLNTWAEKNDSVEVHGQRDIVPAQNVSVTEVRAAVTKKDDKITSWKYEGDWKKSKPKKNSDGTIQKPESRVKELSHANRKDIIGEDTSHTEKAAMAHAAYIQAVRAGNGVMAAEYLRRHSAHKAAAAQARAKMAVTK